MSLLSGNDQCQNRHIDKLSMSEASVVAKKTLKLLLVGNLGTGKTTFVRGYMGHLFFPADPRRCPEYFEQRDVVLDDGTSVTVQLWDIAGQERYGTLTRVYYYEAVGAFVTFDLTRPETLDEALLWKKDLDAKVFTSLNEPIPCIVLGTKLDKCPAGKWAKSDDEMQDFVQTYNFLGFFATSAWDRINLDAAVKALAQYVVENNIETHEMLETRAINLTRPDPIEPLQISCWC
jgi:small GTP-binding protein